MLARGHFVSNFAPAARHKAVVRYALRTQGKSPGFAATAIVTVALGIGANTAIFSAVYLAPLRPCQQPNRLVTLSKARSVAQGTHWDSSYADYHDWQKQAKAFQSMVGFSNVLNQRVHQSLQASSRLVDRRKLRLTANPAASLIFPSSLSTLDFRLSTFFFQPLITHHFVAHSYRRATMGSTRVARRAGR